MKNRLFLVCIVFSFDVLGHDTTHIHPLITLNIAKLIQEKDEGAGRNNAYNEIYKLLPEPKNTDVIPETDQFIYWGTDFDPLEISKQSTGSLPGFLANNDTAPYLLNGIFSGYEPKEKNVITGVVYEDNPALKVRDHFYYAGDGVPLTVAGVALGDASDVRAMFLFNRAVGLMGGYTEEAKQNAFFMFGQALHHVEDMTSPAHVHNDAHLTLSVLGMNFDAGKDDYEGWWLPQQKKNQGSNLENSSYFSTANTIIPVSNPWQNIWGTDATSLVQEVFNGTTYNASLTYTFSVFEEIAGSYEYSSPPNTNETLPLGEMAEMFPCPLPLGKNAPKCLHWSEDAPDAPAHWVIKDVGGFQHQVNTYADDSWWPIVVDTSSSAIGQKPAAFGNKYYIEELASDNEFSYPEGNVLIPAKMRSALGATWDGNMQDNSNGISILEKYANTFLGLAVTYGAGFTQYWYDIANTPPFLQAVTLTQLTANGGVEKIVYEAKWLDEKISPHIVDERLLERKFDKIAQIHDKNDLVIKLEFNEPIKQITELRIGEFNTGGGCALPEHGCADITPAEPVNGAPLANVVFGDLTIPDLEERENDKIWNITVPKSDLSNLNGKLQLTVKALDKNKHTDGQGDITGDELDTTPASPAKRDLSKVMNPDGKLIPEVNDYPWYVYTDDGIDGENDKYAYDYDGGDKNHVFVFDTGEPEVNLSNDFAL